MLVLVDISDLKRNGDRVKRARDYAEGILRAACEPLLVLRADLCIDSVNEAFYRTFKGSREHVKGCSLFTVSGGVWEIPKLRALLEDILPRNSYFESFEVAAEFPIIGHRLMRLSGRPLDYEEGVPHLILLSVEDITLERISLESLRMSENRYRRLFDTATDAILIIDPVNRKIIDGNARAVELLGYTHDAMIGKELWEIGLREDETSSHQIFRELQEKGFTQFCLQIEVSYGHKRDLEVVGNRYLENGHEVIQCNIRDVTVLSEAEKLHKKAEDYGRPAELDVLVDPNPTDLPPV